MASLPVRAVDGILGTHKVGWDPPTVLDLDALGLRSLTNCRGSGRSRHAAMSAAWREPSHSAVWARHGAWFSNWN